jgi:cbb3-type cytochrome oxidase subunit 3
MAPSRPVMYPEQLGLVLLTLVLVGVGVYVFVRVLTE